MRQETKCAPRRIKDDLHPEGRTTVVLGTGSLAGQVVRAIIDHGRGEYHLLGAIDESGLIRVGDDAAGCKVLGPVRRLEKILAAYNPDCVIVSVTDGKLEIMERLLLFLMHSDVSIKPGVEVYEELTGQMPIDTLTPDDFVFDQEVRPGFFPININRLISLLLAAVGIVLTAPLMALIVLLVRIDSEGPAIYVQDRAGLHGRRFGLLKFRTMRIDSSERSVWAAENADRITRVGEWLRRFRLDEFPQLFNVLKGEMNLVGPRPHPSPSSELVELISRNIAECGVAMPYYSMRSMVRPGITGWAQVRYKYANGLGEEIEKLRYDLYYVKHYSVWLDLRILMMTVAVIFHGSGNGRSNDQTAYLATPVSSQSTLLVGLPSHHEEAVEKADGSVKIPRPALLACEGEKRSRAGQ